MDLITDSIVALHPELQTVLDVGCGAGNYTLQLLSKRAPLDCTLVDLSLPMHQRAKERIEKVNPGTVNTVHDAIRLRELIMNHYEALMAAVVLQQLRAHENMEPLFTQMFQL